MFKLIRVRIISLVRLRFTYEMHDSATSKLVVEEQKALIRDYRKNGIVTNLNGISIGKKNLNHFAMNC